jgi:sugar O-acyltransferase (sialic acid O-acetyltransferase NeuD family)
MKPIIIFGASGFGKEAYQLICDINDIHKDWDILGFLDDDDSLHGQIINGLPVLGGIDLLQNFTALNVVIGISDPNLKIRIVKKIMEINKFIDFPTILHPSVSINSKFIKFGVGNIVSEGCLFTTNIEIGDFNTFNTRVTLGHDVKVGNFNSFNPNVQISGNVIIGSSNFFAVNSVVLQGIIIGNDNFIGACSLVIKKIKDNTKVFGIPAQKFIF